MNKNIPQDTQNDNQISKTIRRFFIRFHLSSALKSANAYKKYLCIISTDTELDENEIIRIYGKRWDIEVFFKVCKSYLHLSKECRSISYDAMTAHTAVVFTRYMMLSVKKWMLFLLC